jgi:hypothetical protein
MVISLNLPLENAIQELPVAALRELLVLETREFIDCLDKGSFEELEARRMRIQKIHELLDNLSEAVTGRDKGL